MTEWVDRAAQWCTSLSIADVPPEVLKIGRLQSAAMVATTLSGLATPEVRELQRHLPELPGYKDLTDTTRSVQDMIWLHGAAAMAQDYDDYLFMGHTGHSAVWPSLMPLPDAVAGWTPELGVIIGNELGGRLGAAAALGPRNGQTWNHFHRPVAAALFALRLGCDASGVATAMQISLYQPNMPLYRGFFASDAKLLTAVEPLLGGWLAAVSAAAGHQSGTDLMAGSGGFLDLIASAPLPAMLAGLGRVWVTRSLAIKPYPGCAYLDTTLDSLEEINHTYQEQHGERLPAEEVVRIQVKASLLTTEMNRLGAAAVQTSPLRMVPVNFSIPYSVAVWLLMGGLRGACLDTKVLASHEEMLRALAARVELRHDGAATWRQIRALLRAVRFFPMLRRIGLLRLVRAIRLLEEASGVPAAPRLPLLYALLRTVPWRRWQHAVGRSSLRLLARVSGQQLRQASMAGATFDRPVFTFGASVTVICRDGSRWSARAEVPSGTALREDFAAVVENKWMLEAGRYCSAETSAELWRLMVTEQPLEDWYKTVVESIIKTD